MDRFGLGSAASRGDRRRRQILGQTVDVEGGRRIEEEPYSDNPGVAQESGEAREDVWGDGRVEVGRSG